MMDIDMNDLSNFVLDEYVADVIKRKQQYESAIDRSRIMKSEIIGQLSHAFNQLFDLYTDADFFIWMQYTPSYNDGDATRFIITDLFYGSNKDVMEMCDITDINRIKPDDYRLAMFECEYIRSKDMPPLIKSLMYDLPTVMKIVFGESVYCVIKRGGQLQIEDYEE